MKSRNIYLEIMLLAAACIFTSGLAAQDLEEEGEALAPLYTSEVELGVDFATQDSFKFGEYNGITNSQGYAIGNFMIRKNSAIGDADDQYWELSGTNLGFDSRALYGEYSNDGTYGDYGNNNAFRIFISYNQLPHNRFDDAVTPYAGAGTSNQTLPAGWIGGSTAADLASLSSYFHQVDVGTERDNVGVGFSWRPANGWKIAGEYHHETKDGTEVMSNYMANSRGEFLITPVAYVTNDLDLKLARNTENGQFQLGYHLSLFSDTTRLRYQNLFTQSGALGDPNEMSLPPDNRSHSFTLAAGYNLNPTTRITANMSVNMMQQDDTFLPYSANPSVVITTPLPRANFSGQINNWYATTAISARPLPKLNITGRYSFDYRDNQSPLDSYLYASRDRDTQSTPGSSAERFNVPYGLEKHKVEVDAGYQLMSRARLSAGYVYENLDRNILDRYVVISGTNTYDIGMNERNKTIEHSGNIKLSGSPTELTQGWIKYTHAERSGTPYDSSTPFTFSHVNPYLRTLAPEYTEFENHILLRKFHEADRNRDQVGGNLNYFPNDVFTISVTGTYTSDNYDKSVLGVTDGDNLAATVDLSYNPRENLTTYAYFTHERINNTQKGCDSCATDDPTDTTDPYTYDTNDDVNTFGVGFDWKEITEKLDAKLDLSYSDASTEINPIGGASPATVVQFPDVNSTYVSLKIRADYKYSEQTRIRFHYLFEHLYTADWAVDGLTPFNMGAVPSDTRILGLGYTSPDYNEHVVGVSFLYDF